MSDDLTLRQDRIHRVHCRGVCPVLEVTVTYPILDTLQGAPSASAVRFNQAYRAMAENWLSWTEGMLLERVTAAFAEAGAMAAYRFDRRRATCTMVASALPSEAASLTVTRTVRLVGLGDGPLETVMADTWRWPDLTLAVGGSRRSGKHEKGQNLQ